MAVTSYKAKDEVVLYVNKVGPYANPHETYHYYKLPVCHPDKIEHRSLTLGEVLDGDRMAVSLYNISFLGQYILCYYGYATVRYRNLQFDLEFDARFQRMSPSASFARSP